MLLRVVLLANLLWGNLFFLSINSFVWVFRKKKLSKITDLRFESNPIKLQFILFLKRLPSLQKLSIAGSLSQDNPPLIEQFCQFVSSTSTLKELNISGNEYGVLRTSIIPLLKEMQNNNSIEVLDVSNNNF